MEISVQVFCVVDVMVRVEGGGIRARDLGG